jgi:hypothetical protein
MNAGKASPDAAAAWEEVLTSLCRLQDVLPDAVLVGGTASALYAGHWISFDHDHLVRLPTLPEALRIKAFLCLERNATHDYLDVAALATRLGMDAAFAALEPMDELYPQKGDDPWIVRTQLIKQLADPRPYDLDDVDLAEYKGEMPPLDRWDAVAEVCLRLSERLLQGFSEMLAAASSPDATAARASLEDWQQQRGQDGRPMVPKLPGLRT